MLERNVLDDTLTASAALLRDRLGGCAPKVGIVLGSGLNPLANRVQDPRIVPYADVPHVNMSTAESHVGRFVCGNLGGKEVLCMQGRLHGYEGNSAQEVAYPIWLMARMGIEYLITTNAAGGINESFNIGDFCMMSDHINFTGRNPIAAPDPANLSDRFFSMTDAYDVDMRSLARQVAHENGVCLQEGVYLGLLGPSFETPAEIRMFRSWGADTVAMSVVEEVIAARHVGVKVLGISLVSNRAAGIEGASPNGIEVLEVAKVREDDFERLVTGIVAQL